MVFNSHGGYTTDTMAIEKVSMGNMGYGMCTLFFLLLSFFVLVLFLFRFLFLLISPRTSLLRLLFCLCPVSYVIRSLHHTYLANLTEPPAYNTTHVLEVSKEDIGLSTSLTDLTGVLIFLFFIHMLDIYQQEQTEKYNKEVLTIVRYSIKVTEIPEDCFDRREIKKFFQRFGKVVDVAIAYNDGDVVELYKQRGRLRKQIAAAQVAGDESGLKKMLGKLKKIDQGIRATEEVFVKKSVALFVTYELQESVLECIHSYPDSFWSRLVMPQDLRFKGKRIRVTRAPEPSNILFLNLKYSKKSRMLRRMFTFFLSFLIISVSMAVVYTAQVYQRQLPQEEDCPTQVTRADAEADPTLKECYCRQLGTDVLDERPFCNDWIEQFTITRILIVVSAMTIVIVNVLLKVVTTKLGRFEKHFSVTSEQSAITRKLFVGLFLNTGLVMLMVNWDLESSVGSSIGTEILFAGEYSDFTPDWYQIVGVSIVFTMMLNMFNPHILAIMDMPVQRCKRKRQAKKKRTQYELNDLYKGAEFQLAERYASILNTIFVALFYSAGLPVMLVIAATTFFLMYWFDKYSFLRYYRLPVRYDNSLAKQAVHVMPYAVLVHLAISIWFWSSPVLSSYSVNSDQVDSSVNSVDGDIFNLKNRIVQWNVFPSFVVLLLLVFIRIFRATVWKVLRQPCRTIMKGNKISPLTRNISLSEAKEKVKFESYHLARQRGYLDAFIKTDSHHQLVPEEELKDDDEWDQYVEENRKRRSADGTHNNVAVNVTKVHVPGARSPPSSKRDLRSESPVDMRGTASHNLTQKQQSELELERHIRLDMEAAMRNDGYPSQQVPVESYSPPIGSHSTTLSHGSSEVNIVQTPAMRAAQQIESRREHSRSYNFTADGARAWDPATYAPEKSTRASASQEDFEYRDLVEISCFNCTQHFKIVDIGTEAEYTCPFCAIRFIV